MGMLAGWLLMLVAMRSLVTSYSPLSLLTSPLHIRAYSPSYSSPVHDARRPTRNDHNETRDRRLGPTIYRTAISRRPLPYLSTALTTHTHCHAHRLSVTSLTTSLSLVNVVLSRISTTSPITLRKDEETICFLAETATASITCQNHERHFIVSLLYGWRCQVKNKLKSMLRYIQIMFDCY